MNGYSAVKVVVNPEITKKVQAAETAAISKYLECVYLLDQISAHFFFIQF